MNMQPLAPVAESQAPARTRALVAGLRSPACYPHSVEGVEVMQTHISFVLLAGEFAYKIKKPVRFAFLDFTDLESRRHYCEEELRLNRRTAPSLYRDVVAITGTPQAPIVGDGGPAIEYAVRMHRFAQDDLLDHRAREARLRPADVDSLAAITAAFHGQALRARADSPFGTARLVLEQALDNISAIERIERGGDVLRTLADIRVWTRLEHAARATAFDARRGEGFVRECHGDLHLGNVVLLGGAAVPFDCIEFDARLRMIDVMSDVAFTWMDLEYHGLPRLAARYLDEYLQRTGDFAGLALLRFYAVYRAMVRAKIACLRAHPVAPDDRRDAAAFESLRRHVALAHRLSRHGCAGLVLMHGLSGSGKSTLAGQLLETLGAIRLRSDVERKRLHGLAPLAASGSSAGGGIYGNADTQATYERLAALARDALAEGYRVIVDATFLHRAQREAFRRLAARMGAAFAIVACEAPEAALRQRLAIRARGAGDASEADAAVLAMQIARREPLDEHERASAILVDTEREGALREAEHALVRRL